MLDMVQMWIIRYHSNLVSGGFLEIGAVENGRDITTAIEIEVIGFNCLLPVGYSPRALLNTPYTPAQPSCSTFSWPFSSGIFYPQLYFIIRTKQKHGKIRSIIGHQQVDR